MAPSSFQAWIKCMSSKAKSISWVSPFSIVCSSCGTLFLSKEAVAAGRRYEKETSTCIQVAFFRARTYLLSPLPRPPPPHPPLTDAIREAGWLCSPPPSTHAFPMLNLCDFQRLGQKRGWPLFRGSKVLQLNSDSFCDYVRIWTEVIGHLWAELGFWFFPGKRWKYMRPQIFGQDANILASRAGTTAVTVRQRRRPYKLGGLGAAPTWELHGGETTSPERELFSQT